MNAVRKRSRVPAVSEQSQASVQYDLFCQFVSNDPTEISNAIERWESIPKYFLNSQQVRKLRDEKGRADPFTWTFRQDRQACQVEIQPASIKQANGSYLACFPGVTEELVEEALKKILTDQQYGLHIPESPETWVRFSLQMIKRELKSRGRERNIAEIKHAIAVLSSCIITYSIDGKEFWRGAVLQDLVTIGRDEYLADRESLHMARLPVFYSSSINQLAYRQYNFDRLMSCSEQLTRWIYKRLINNYTQASIGNDYHFMYSSIQDSGLLQVSREIDGRKKVISALEELKERGVLMAFDSDPRKEGRKVVDVKYTVRPSLPFIKEQKAANKRLTDGVEKARQVRLPAVAAHH